MEGISDSPSLLHDGAQNICLVTTQIITSAEDSTDKGLHKSPSTPCMSLSTWQPHLVAVHHEVVCGDQSFENHHPAGVAHPLHQRVGHLGDVHVGVLGGLDQI